MALALGSVAGWLGGELVDRLGVGVDDGAHLDAPSSLSGPAGPANVALSHGDLIQRVSCTHSPRTALRMERFVAARRQHTGGMRERRAVVRVLLPRSAVPEDVAAGGQRPFTVAVRGGASRAPRHSRSRYIYPELTEFGGGGSGQSGDDVSTDADGIPHRALSLRAVYTLSLGGLTRHA